MIPNKKITLEEFYDITTWNKITFGGEAIICESDNPYSLYKLFTNLDKPKPMGKNKEKKIELLYELSPDFIIGYEMTTDFELKSYKPYQLSSEELKYFLTKTKEILEYFSSLGIIYGDVEFRNILFNKNTGDIKFCDMDNISINNLSMDVTPLNLQPYEEVKKIDSNVHPYMHNLMTLKSLGMDSYWASKFDIKKHFKKPAIKTVYSMRDPKNFNNEYIIDHVKKLIK